MKKPLRLRYKILFSVIGVGAVLLVLGAWLLVGRLAPESVPVVPPPQEAVLLRQVITKFSGSLLTPDGRLAAVAAVTLNAEELDALFANAIRLIRKPDGPRFACRWVDGGASAAISLPWVAGLAWNMKARFQPFFTGGKPGLRVLAASFGAVSLPTARVQSEVDRALDAELAKPEIAAIVAAIQAVEITPQGDLTIRFEPRKVAFLLGMLMRRR